MSTDSVSVDVPEEYAVVAQIARVVGTHKLITYDKLCDGTIDLAAFYMLQSVADWLDYMQQVSYNRAMERNGNR